MYWEYCIFSDVRLFRCIFDLCLCVYFLSNKFGYSCVCRFLFIYVISYLVIFFLVELL